MGGTAEAQPQAAAPRPPGESRACPQEERGSQASPTPARFQLRPRSVGPHTCAHLARAAPCGSGVILLASAFSPDRVCWEAQGGGGDAQGTFLATCPSSACVCAAPGLPSAGELGR